MLQALHLKKLIIELNKYLYLIGEKLEVVYDEPIKRETMMFKIQGNNTDFKM